MSRHLTPDEIALNQQEARCRAELEALEIQEARLDSELDQDIDVGRCWPCILSEFCTKSYWLNTKN